MRRGWSSSFQELIMSRASGDLLKVAIIGSGPAGFYLADALLKQQELPVRVDLFERLFAPYGLVRYGVAPDHQKIKSVTRVFDKIAQHPRFAYYGNVTVGEDVSLEELLERYHQVAFCTGCEDSRELGIDGEHGAGSHSATEFVAWYNGHPELRHYEVSLDTESAVVVGIGDVSMDVTRMLLKPLDQLGQTDCTDYALSAFRQSKVRHVHLLARRGPAEAKFADKELRDIAEMEDVAIHVDRELLDAALLEEGLASDVRRKLDQLIELEERDRARRATAGKHVHLQFLCSPSRIELAGGRVSSLVIERNRLLADENGQIAAVGTGIEEKLDVGLVFRAVGYRGRPLNGVPFDARRGLIPNVAGRVTSRPDGEIIPRVYASGWIKRGPSGVIGTNKSDSADTALRMLEDLRQGVAELPLHAPVTALLAERGKRVISFADWQKLDRIESELGKKEARPRNKFVSVTECLRALESGA
jgi:ferredoxin--NADP+ reductase